MTFHKKLLAVIVAALINSVLIHAEDKNGFNSGDVIQQFWQHEIKKEEYAPARINKIDDFVVCSSYESDAILVFKNTEKQPYWRIKASGNVERVFNFQSKFIISVHKGIDRWGFGQSQLACFDPLTKSQSWSLEIDSPLLSSVEIGNELYCHAPGKIGSRCIVISSEGKVIRDFPLPFYGYVAGPFLYKDQILYFGDVKGGWSIGNIFAYDVKTGKELWTMKVGLAAGNVKITNQYMSIFKVAAFAVVDLDKKEIIYQLPLSTGQIVYSPLIYGDTIILSGYKWILGKGSYVKALQLSTGKELWSRAFDSSMRIASSFLNSNNKLICLGFDNSEKSWILTFEPESGKSATKYSISGNVDGWSQSVAKRTRPSGPISLGNQIAFGSTDGILWSYILP